MVEKHNYIKKLQEINSKDVFRFMSIYVEASEKRIDITQEAAKMLAGMGIKAVEEVAIMLNDRSITERFRSSVANFLMRAIGMQAETVKSEVIKKELLKAVDTASTNEEDFVSSNAAETLIKLGVKGISQEY